MRLIYHIKTLATDLFLAFYAIALIYVLPSPGYAQTPTFTRLSASPDGRHAVLWDESMQSAANSSARSGVVARVDLESGDVKQITLKRKMFFAQWYEDGNRILIRLGAIVGILNTELELLDEARTMWNQYHILWTPLAYLSDSQLDNFLDLRRNSLPYGRSPLASNQAHMIGIVGEAVRFETLRRPILSYSETRTDAYQARKFWYYAGALGDLDAGHECLELLRYHYQPVIDHSTGSVSGCFSQTDAIVEAVNGLPERRGSAEKVAFEGKAVIDAMSNRQGSFLLLQEPGGRQSIGVTTGSEYREIDVGEERERADAGLEDRPLLRYLSYSDSRAPFGFLVSRSGAKKLVVRFHGGPRAHPLNGLTLPFDAQLHRQDMDVLEVFGAGALGGGERALEALKKDQEEFRKRLFRELKRWISLKNYEHIVVYGASFGAPYAVHFAEQARDLEPTVILVVPALNLRADTLIHGEPFKTNAPAHQWSVQRQYELAVFGHNYRNREIHENYSDRARQLVCELPKVTIFYGGKDRLTPPLMFNECSKFPPSVVVYPEESHGTVLNNPEFIERFLRILNESY